MQHSCALPLAIWVLLHANQPSMAWIWFLERQKQLSLAIALLTASAVMKASLIGMIASRVAPL
jgi:hypothetical protein